VSDWQVETFPTSFSIVLPHVVVVINIIIFNFNEKGEDKHFFESDDN
jgi:hypothetical protein